MSEKIPERIYKFEDFNIQSIKNLKSHTIYFGSPKNFNDPYDCAIRAEIVEPTEEQVTILKNYYLQHKETSEQAKAELTRMNSASFKALIERSARSVSNMHAEKFINENGVSCFSETNDDLLMWSHYGGKHKGFCLEFSTGSKPFNKLRKVKYKESMPKIDPISILINSDYDQFLDLYCTKSKSWEYEKEWRALHHVAGTAFTYPSESLRGIYFGPDIDNVSLEILCLIIQGQNPDVLFYKGKRNDEKFKIEFQQFTYTSHIEAKRQGLIT
ncbi:DUF2971 domain-containing protein [Microbulbifer sp. ANSA003]|uniref:DUF2971 domain-containing protein n=1 Tax=Microbulbifer sp. ANSA003 TaxID=3243360 RepID=UPI0040435D40